MKQTATEKRMFEAVPVEKSVSERSNFDLLELVLQLHARALLHPSETMHETYVEARAEMTRRLREVSPVSSSLEVSEKEIDKARDYAREYARRHIVDRCTTAFVDGFMLCFKSYMRRNH